jgi:hypothetical protein
MSRETRKNLIEQIEKKRGSKVIVYVTNDRYNQHISQDVIPIIHKHLLAFDSSSQKLDLFLYSRGGDSDVPWALVSMFREYAAKGSFSVLIPYRSHSAATVIAVGADEIVMTKKAELGPIDITMERGPYNPTDKKSNQPLPVSVEDVKGYFSLIEKQGAKEPDDVMKGFELLTHKVHPLALGRVNRLLEETKLVALRLLSTRENPFEDKDNQEIVKILSSEVYSHSHAISRTEAMKFIGLKHVKNAEDFGIENLMWSLYEEYDELFEFNTPFLPDQYLIEKKLDENTWENVNLACVESLNRFDHLNRSISIRRLRQIPTNLNLNLAGINLPEINIPKLSTGIGPTQFKDMINLAVDAVVQQQLSTIREQILIELSKSLPLAGFETSSFGYKWTKED